MKKLNTIIAAILATSSVAGIAHAEEASDSNEERFNDNMQRMKTLGEQKIERDQLELQLREQAKQVQLHQMMMEAMPLTADTIRSLKGNAEDVRGAVKGPVSGMPTQKMSMHILEVEENKPITLQVAPRFVSSVVFTDQSGNPWPITDIVVADSTAFDARAISEHKNTMTVSMKQLVGQSNMLVSLEGMSMPILFTLNSNAHEVDGRLDIRIPKVLPGNEEAFMAIDDFARTPETDSSVISKIMHGDSPAGSVVYKLDGAKGHIYEYNKEYYLRTPHRLISPAWKGGEKSPSGMRVYRIPRMKRLLMAVDGQKKWVSVGQPIDVRYIMNGQEFSGQ